MSKIYRKPIRIGALALLSAVLVLSIILIEKGTSNVQANLPGGSLPNGHYLYALTDGGMYVYNMDTGFSFVKQKSLPTTAGTRGVAVDPATHAMFISFGGDGGGQGNGSVLKYDLLTDQVIWNTAYSHGVDSIALTPDGSSIYVPSGELSTDGKWYVVNAATGNETGAVIDTQAGTGDNGPHNTVVSLDGKYVFMGDRNIYPGGSNYFYVGSIASNTVIKKVGPFQSGIRPFTVNRANTLVYTAVTGFLGFQVGDLNTGKVLYTVPITKPANASCNNSGASTPSHGISLSPDEKSLYVLDYTCNYVHRFDVSNVPASAPVQKADIPVAQFNPAENPCAYDCLGDGWLLHSLDGSYVIVGDSGSIIKTADNSLVPADNSPTGFSTILHNTRKFIEVDWQCGVTVATTTRDGLGRVGFSTPTPTPCPTPTPTSPTTPTPTHIPAATPTPTPTFTSMLGLANYRNAVLADKPQFYYRLDEASGTVAHDIAGSHTGTYTNATLNQSGATTDGDKAISGNGLTMKYTAGTGLPIGASARSVEFWFKTTATPSSPYGSTFLSYGSGNTNQMFAAKLYQGTNGQSYMKLTNWTASYLYPVPTGANPLDGTWHYVVATFDGTNSSVYYDGHSLGQQTTSFNTVLNTNGLYLGLQTPNAGSPYNGSLDEVAIYNYVLTPAQVQTHLFQSSTGF